MKTEFQSVLQGQASLAIDQKGTQLMDTFGGPCRSWPNIKGHDYPYVSQVRMRYQCGGNVFDIPHYFPSGEETLYLT